MKDPHQTRMQHSVEKVTQVKSVFNIIKINYSSMQGGSGINFYFLEKCN